MMKKIHHTLVLPSKTRPKNKVVVLDGTNPEDYKKFLKLFGEPGVKKKKINMKNIVIEYTVSIENQIVDEDTNSVAKRQVSKRTMVYPIPHDVTEMQLKNMCLDSIKTQLFNETQHDLAARLVESVLRKLKRKK